jgi:hypothetical protein
LRRPFSDARDFTQLLDEDLRIYNAGKTNPAFADPASQATNGLGARSRYTDAAELGLR